MSKLKQVKTRFKLSEPMYDSECTFHIGYTTDEYERWIKKTYGLNLEFEDGFAGRFDTFVRNGVRNYDIYIKKWDNDSRSHSVLVHEIFHFVAANCSDIGISFSSDSEEVYAYMLDHFYEMALEKIWGKMKKLKSKPKSKASDNKS